MAEGRTSMPLPPPMVWVYPLPPFPPYQVKKADYLAWLEAQRGN